MLVCAALDATLIAGLLTHSPALFANLARFWLPLALVFVVTWATGAIVAMRPSTLGAPRVHPNPR